MTNLTLIILSILLAMRPNAADTENDAEREQRLTVVAQAISDAAYRQTLTTPANAAAALVSLAWHGTQVGQAAHEGECSSQEDCQARQFMTLWQIRSSEAIPKKDLISMRGTSFNATALASSWANASFHKAYRKCKTYAGAYSFYATGRYCGGGGSSEKVKLHRFLLLQIAEKLKHLNTPQHMTETVSLKSRPDLRALAPSSER